MKMMKYCTFWLFLSITAFCCKKGGDDNLPAPPPPTPPAPVPTSVITGISPTSGGSGTTITITGSNFSTASGGNVVMVNGLNATILSATSTQIVIVVPDGGGGPVTVINSGGTTVGPTFTYNISDVYIAGYTSGTAVNWRFAATYWKNGVPVYLSSGINEAKAVQIAVSGNDVYVVGYENTAPSAPNKKRAVVWKNGIPTYLTSGINSEAEARDIKIVGNDVYIAGYEEETSTWRKKAKIWVNGVGNYIAGDETESYATGIGLIGSKPCITGMIIHPITGGKTATCWVDNSQVELFPRTQQSYVMDMVVSGETIYMTGNRNNGMFVNKIMKNGTLVNLPAPTTGGMGFATAVAGDGNDVYVAAYVNSKPGYWKNQTSYNAGPRGTPYDIRVVNGDVYLCGFSSPATSSEILPTMWLNNSQVILGYQDAFENMANGIYIK